MVLHLLVECFNYLCKYRFHFYSTELKAKNIFKMVTVNNMNLMNWSNQFHPFNNLLKLSYPQTSCKMMSQRATRKSYEDSLNLYAFT